MNAQPKITAATTQPHSLFPSFTGYGGSDLEVNLAYREEIRKLRKENEELKDENIALEAAFDAISGQNDQLLRILGDRVAFAAEILEGEAVESNFTPEQSATWRFLDEVGLTPKTFRVSPSHFHQKKLTRSMMLESRFSFRQILPKISEEKPPN